MEAQGLLPYSHEKTCLSSSWTKAIQSTPYPISCRPILILFFLLRPGFPRGPFVLGFPNKIYVQE